MAFSGLAARGAVVGLEELLGRQLAEEMARREMEALQEERLAQRDFRERDLGMREVDLGLRFSQDQRERAEARAKAEKEATAATARRNMAEIANVPGAENVLAEYQIASGQDLPAWVTKRFEKKDPEYVNVQVPGKHPLRPITKAFLKGGPELEAGVETWERPHAPQAPEHLTPNNIASLAMRLGTKWEGITKNAREMRVALSRMEDGLRAARRGDMNAGTQAVIATFNKVLDPGSVVRESEYDRTAQGQAFVSRIEGMIDTLEQGGARVPLSQLETFARLAREMTAQAEQMLGPERERIAANADYFGVPQQLIFPQGGPGTPTIKFDNQGNRIK